MKTKKKAVIDSFHGQQIPPFFFDEVKQNEQARATEFHLAGELVASLQTHMLYAWHSEEVSQ